jgi:hypothetical protein
MEKGRERELEKVGESEEKCASRQVILSLKTF